MAKFQMKERINSAAKTARLAEGTDSANATPATLITNNHGVTEIGKALKLIGESRFALCAAGDPIEGFAISTEIATVDGYNIGSVQEDGCKEVMFDGLQATAGTGTIAIGDYVVTGTITAKGTLLPAQVKVCKATQQPGAVPADLTAAGLQARNAAYAWRVVSLGSAGTGAVGTVGVIERVC